MLHSFLLINTDIEKNFGSKLTDLYFGIAFLFPRFGLDRGQYRLVTWLFIFLKMIKNWHYFTPIYKTLEEFKVKISLKKIFLGTPDGLV